MTAALCCHIFRVKLWWSTAHNMTFLMWQSSWIQSGWHVSSDDFWWDDGQLWVNIKPFVACNILENYLLQNKKIPKERRGGRGRAFPPAHPFIPVLLLAPLSEGCFNPTFTPTPTSVLDRLCRETSLSFALGEGLSLGSCLPCWWSESERYLCSHPEMPALCPWILKAGVQCAVLHSLGDLERQLSFCVSLFPHLCNAKRKIKLCLSTSKWQ